jgi:hypothetical protein
MWYLMVDGDGVVDDACLAARALTGPVLDRRQHRTRVQLRTALQPGDQRPQLGRRDVGVLAAALLDARVEDLRADLGER